MAIQSEDELKMELKKAEEHLKNLKAKDKDEQDNQAIYLAEIDVRRLKNLLGGNEKQEDIATRPSDGYVGFIPLGHFVPEDNPFDAYIPPET